MVLSQTIPGSPTPATEKGPFTRPFDRVEVAGVTRHPSHTTGRAVFSHPAVEALSELTDQVAKAKEAMSVKGTVVQGLVHDRVARHPPRPPPTAGQA